MVTLPHNPMELAISSNPWPRRQAPIRHWKFSSCAKLQAGERTTEPEVVIE